MKGTISKLIGVLDENNLAHYAIPINGECVGLSEHIGKTITIEHTGHIECIACQRVVKKTYSQGYCFPCTQRLAQCDLCIVKPERCHFHLGTCREPDWGDQHCMRPHYVYLANSSGLKVGITREQNIPSRWIDQGATEAIKVMKVTSRRLSGLIEVAIAKYVADKTNWRKMLSGSAEPVNLIAKREELMSLAKADIDAITAEFGEDKIEYCDDYIQHIDYPVLSYPSKITSLNLEKTPRLEGQLVGIKGQYVILQGGVLNIRKYTGYELALAFEG